MNQLRSWLYSRDIEKRWPPQEDENPMLHQENGSPVEKEVADSQIRRLLLRVVPLQPGDCLGCKLVGTTVMAASGVIVILSARTGRARNPRQNLLLYNIVCGSLFLGFEVAALSRFLDLGPFAKIAQLQRKNFEDG